MQSSDSSTKSFGQIGYEAYGNHPGPAGTWATYDGRAMPSWPDLGGADAGKLIQSRWEVAVAAAIAEHERRKQACPGKTLGIAEFTVTMDTTQARAELDLLEAKAERVGEALSATSTLTDEGRIDPFLMGIQEIASATRDLAEATRALDGVPSSRAIPVAELIADVTKALHDRVKALAAPP